MWVLWKRRKEIHLFIEKEDSISFLSSSRKKLKNWVERADERFLICFYTCLIVNLENNKTVFIYLKNRFFEITDSYQFSFSYHSFVPFCLQKIPHQKLFLSFFKINTNHHPLSDHTNIFLHFSVNLLFCCYLFM